MDARTIENAVFQSAAGPTANPATSRRPRAGQVPLTRSSQVLVIATANAADHLTRSRPRPPPDATAIAADHDNTHEAREYAHIPSLMVKSGDITLSRVPFMEINNIKGTVSTVYCIHNGGNEDGLSGPRTRSRTQQDSYNFSNRLHDVSHCYIISIVAPARKAAAVYMSLRSGADEPASLPASEASAEAKSTISFQVAVWISRRACEVDDAQSMQLMSQVTGSCVELITPPETRTGEAWPLRSVSTF